MKEFSTYLIHLLGKREIIPYINLREDNNIVTIYSYKSKDKSVAIEYNKMSEISAILENNKQFEPLPVIRIRCSKFNSTSDDRAPFYVTNTSVRLAPIQLLNNTSDITLIKNDNRSTFNGTVSEQFSIPPIDSTAYPRNSVLRYDHLDPNNLQNRYK